MSGVETRGAMRPPWDAADAFRGLLFGLFMGLFLLPLIVVPFDPELDSVAGRLTAQGLLVAALVGVPIAFARRAGLSGAGAARALGLRRFRPGAALGWAALATFAYLTLALVYATLVTEPEQVDIPRELGFGETVAGTVGAIALVVVAAAFSEELFFRGFLHGGLRRAMAPLPAALVGGAIFGAIHLPSGPTAVPPLMIFGVVLALLYERTGSIWPPIALHMANNAVAFSLTA